MEFNVKKKEEKIFYKLPALGECGCIVILEPDRFVFD